MKLLHLDSSLLGEGSASRQLTRSIVGRLRRDHPGLDVSYRDLDATPLTHLTGADLAAARQPADSLDDVAAASVRANAAILQEFLAADIVVVGAPMYNFGIPSVLKAWIDRISIAGVTFRYTEKGPEGLSGGKRVVIASSRGGLYAEGSPFAANDFQETYLRAVFAFLGVTDVQVVRAEGLALGPEQRQAALQAALGEPDRQAA
jgi:FMN-dependent NADH-azoreductase